MFAIDLLQRCHQDPKRFTYLGIGSCPHVHSLEELTPRMDQLLPVPLTSELQGPSVRVLHIDPAFDLRSDLLTAYFASKLPDAVVSEEDGIRCWRTDTIEICIASGRLNHHEDYWFFEQLCNGVLETGGELIVQEYTGEPLSRLANSLFTTSSNPIAFKRKILFDITYGTDIGCMTDLEKFPPLRFPSSRHFFNVSLYTEAEIQQLLPSMTSAMCAIVRQTYTTRSKQLVNTYHVDYRRRLRGETVFCTSTDYSHTSPPHEIMTALEQKLFLVLHVLRALGAATNTQLETIRQLFSTYPLHDPYKWYDCVWKELTKENL
jgi:hypothetical protein